MLGEEGGVLGVAGESADAGGVVGGKEAWCWVEGDDGAERWVRWVVVVVASTARVRVACQTPRQRQLANALWRLVEIADPIT